MLRCHICEDLQPCAAYTSATYSAQTRQLQAVCWLHPGCHSVLLGCRARTTLAVQLVRQRTSPARQPGSFWGPCWTQHAAGWPSPCGVHWTSQLTSASSMVRSVSSALHLVMWVGRRDTAAAGLALARLCHLHSLSDLVCPAEWTQAHDAMGMPNSPETRVAQAWVCSVASLMKWIVCKPTVGRSMRVRMSVTSTPKEPALRCACGCCRPC